jgi:hypothetical protein
MASARDMIVGLVASPPRRRGSLEPLGGDEGVPGGIENGSTTYSRPPVTIFVVTWGVGVSRLCGEFSEPSGLSRIISSRCLLPLRERPNANIPNAPASRPRTMPPTPAPIAAGIVDDDDFCSVEPPLHPINENDETKWEWDIQVACVKARGINIVATM